MMNKTRSADIELGDVLCICISAESSQLQVVVVLMLFAVTSSKGLMWSGIVHVNVGFQVSVMVS